MLFIDIMVGEINKVQFRKLGDLSVPVIGMGTYVSFDVSSENDIGVRHKIIDECIEHGVTLLDSSPMYGHAERVIHRIRFLAEG